MFESKISVYDSFSTKYTGGKKILMMLFLQLIHIKGIKADLSMKEVVNYACINYSPVSGRYILA